MSNVDLLASPYSKFYYPVVCQSLPEGSCDKAIGSFGLRSLWHSVYDSCSHLQAILEPEANSMFDRYLNHHIESGGTLGWSFSAFYLIWLEEHLSSILPSSVGDFFANREAITLEMLQNSAMQWCQTDRSKESFIVLLSTYGRVPLGVLGRKLSNLNERHPTCNEIGWQSLSSTSPGICWCTTQAQDEVAEDVLLRLRYSCDHLDSVEIFR